jgi:23S rRNA U2552 (ribose-2'-O)-methylase RlmE/FtsJ
MANIDAIYNLLNQNKSQKLLFADICSGPGGFTEYIFWRSKQQSRPCRGWGITLKGNQDYELDSMVVKPTDFSPYYGDGTGDLYKLENLKGFVKKVLEESKGGVSLVAGDGGFSVVGDEEYVEEHSRQLILSQIVTMFSILKKEGNFVLKVFDLLTDFSIEMVYLLYLHFQKISIIKPLSSRSGNSERYLVCLNLQKQQPKELIEYLTSVLQKFNDLRPSLQSPKSGHLAHQPGFVKKQEMIDLGLLEIVNFLDINEIQKDEVFIDAISGSNMK